MGKRKQQACVFCGDTGSTVEHVLQQAFFPAGLVADHPCVPCCEKCNHDGNVDIEALQFFIASQLADDQATTTQSEHLVENVKRAIKRFPGKRTKHLHVENRMNAKRSPFRVEFTIESRTTLKTGVLKRLGPMWVRGLAHFLQLGKYSPDAVVSTESKVDRGGTVRWLIAERRANTSLSSRWNWVPTPRFGGLGVWVVRYTNERPPKWQMLIHGCVLVTMEVIDNETTAR